MWADRIIDDGTHRGRWETARHHIIGASDVKAYARPSSVVSYFEAKLAGRDFHGNAFTERGHEWEPVLLEHVGVPQNVALVASPDEPGFAATVDGISRDGSVLVECKIRHNKVAGGPSVPEFRQLAWQFQAIPEAHTVHFVEGELVSSALGWQMRERGPQVTVIGRDDPRITDALALVRPIAVDVLALVRTHCDLERSFDA